MIRIALGVVTSLLCLGSTRAGEPIPQDPAKSAALAAERLEWNRRTLVGVYEKSGKKDPRWDAKAREALELAARMFSKQVDPQVYFGDILAPAREAVAAGCDDPMIRYLVERGAPADTPREAWSAGMKSAVAAVVAGPYPAVRKAAAHRVLGQSILRLGGDGDARKDAQAQYDASLPFLAVRDEEGPICDGHWYEILMDLIRGYCATGLDLMTSYERVDAALAKAPWMDALRERIRGECYIAYAWEARTNAFAKDVPPGGFEKMAERLAVARRALERSWAIRPDAAVAARMLTVHLGTDGDREAMDAWFDRAMRLNPDEASACLIKLDWVDPKWHGSWEECIDFGRACLATGNWRTGITLIAADAHHRYALRLAPDDWEEYLGSPEVWADIGPPYEEYFGHFPKDFATRSKFALLNYRAGRYREAHAQFQHLGDRLTTWETYPQVPLMHLEEVRDYVAKEVAEKPPAEAGAKP